MSMTRRPRRPTLEQVEAMYRETEIDLKFARNRLENAALLRVDAIVLHRNVAHLQGWLEAIEFSFGLAGTDNRVSPDSKKETESAE